MTSLLQVLGARGPAASVHDTSPPTGTVAVLKGSSPHGSRKPVSTLPKWKLRHTRLHRHTSQAHVFTDLLGANAS